jgi:hypothetical protein
MAKEFPGRTEVNIKNRWAVLVRRENLEQNSRIVQRVKIVAGRPSRPRGSRRAKVTGLPGIDEIIGIDNIVTEGRLLQEPICDQLPEDEFGRREEQANGGFTLTQGLSYLDMVLVH